MTSDRLAELYPDEAILVIDGMDEAIIGVEENSFRVVYSKKKIYEILQRDMEEIDAIEHYNFNINNAYVGTSTPILCDDLGE